MYAIIENGSHQYRVEEGQLLKVDRKPGNHGAELVFDRVLLIAGTGAEPIIGAPFINGATVAATLEQTFRSRKLIIRKFRRRKGYRRKKGHRQYYTTVRITSISGG
jgi:large subunit ribosomal protein L21